MMRGIGAVHKNVLGAVKCPFIVLNFARLNMQNIAATCHTTATRVPHVATNMQTNTHPLPPTPRLSIRRGMWHGMWEPNVVF